MKIPDTFIAVPRPNRARRDTDPMVTIATRKSYGGARLVLTKPLRVALGVERHSNDRVYVEVFVSASTVKLVVCSKDAENARVISASGSIAVKQVAHILDLPDEMTYRCKAEVVKNGKLEIWATYPKELREHIERLNGAAR